MLFTLGEIVDIVLMTAIIGYLFQDAFRLPRKDGDILEAYLKKGVWHRDWHDFWWACALVAPSIVLHELAHKFTALSFGLDAVFHAACSVSDAGFSTFCMIQLAAVAMKAFGFGFLIFVPGYVSIAGGASELSGALISFAGPAVHLAFWLGCMWVTSDKKRIRKWPERKRFFVFFLQKINMFLFILNMLPIPGFDGFNIYMHLYRAFF